MKILVCPNRQISQEDKNWEQNIQELQKKVRFYTNFRHISVIMVHSDSEMKFTWCLKVHATGKYMI